MLFCERAKSFYTCTTSFTARTGYAPRGTRPSRRSPSPPSPLRVSRAPSPRQKVGITTPRASGRSKNSAWQQRPKQVRGGPSEGGVAVETAGEGYARKEREKGTGS
ncbi:hypothetical protein GWI33_011616 [Rhynchophorus ferrugineus]|uniref:Uncharacterized protein n=1 Tax=Rhynchophorus ferrugineus TaxID=354439 RepID=A0A834I6S6_RHYFE|nr:hypothetical protein GWI33_011616 [Rhynchophorus ferrugineus]